MTFLLTFISFTYPTLHLAVNWLSDTCNVQPLKVKAVITLARLRPTQEAAQLSRHLSLHCYSQRSNTAPVDCGSILCGHADALLPQRPLALLATNFVSLRWFRRLELRFITVALTAVTVNVLLLNIKTALFASFAD